MSPVCGGGWAYMDCERVGCGCLVWLRLLAAYLFVGVGCSFYLWKSPTETVGHMVFRGAIFLSHVCCAPN